LKKNTKKNKSRLGILGGTFDPPHVGHLHISKVAIKKLKLNKILWIVTKKNPLKKKPYLDKKIRMELSKVLTENNKKIFVKYYDDKIKSSSSFKIINYIKKRNKNSKIFFLIGADNLKSFHKWKNWEKIPRMAKIVIFPRKGYSYSSFMRKNLSKKDIIFIKSKKVDISSSLIRKFW
tara:strand:+ start:20 stop:550 length:531 start_codon:yes stop_codon:yes gene_type:complete